MADDIQTRMSAEGADPLLFAGVNDSNLLELQRALGVRVSLPGRCGDAVAAPRTRSSARARSCRVCSTWPAWVSRSRRTTSPGWPPRASQASCPRQTADGKIVLPGLRRAIVPKTQGQRDYLQAISNHDIVVGIGPAGTGKTYLAVAKAVEALARKRVKRIILARPAVEAGESLGFLPGDLQAKVDPVSAPAVRRAGRHDAARSGAARSGDPHHRDRSAGIHAGAHPGRRVHHPG